MTAATGDRLPERLGLDLSPLQGRVVSITSSESSHQVFEGDAAATGGISVVYDTNVILNAHLIATGAAAAQSSVASAAAGVASQAIAASASGLAAYSSGIPAVVQLLAAGYNNAAIALAELSERRLADTRVEHDLIFGPALEETEDSAGSILGVAEVKSLEQSAQTTACDTWSPGRRLVHRRNRQLLLATPVIAAGILLTAGALSIAIALVSSISVTALLIPVTSIAGALAVVLALVYKYRFLPGRAMELDAWDPSTSIQDENLKRALGLPIERTGAKLSGQLSVNDWTRAQELSREESGEREGDQ